MTETAPSTLTVFGADWCRDCLRSKALLDGLGVEYTYVDLVADESAAERAQAISGRTQIPVVVFPDNTHQVEPSDRDLSAKLAELGIITQA
ncbi:MAG: glutaredoxin family protein [Mycetocola sp.]